MDTPVRVQYRGRIVPLGGRVAAMVCLLAERAQWVNDHQRVKVEFDCAGQKVKSRYTVFEDEEPIVVR